MNIVVIFMSFESQFMLKLGCDNNMDFIKYHKFITTLQSYMKNVDCKIE